MIVMSRAEAPNDVTLVLTTRRLRLSTLVSKFMSIPFCFWQCILIRIFLLETLASTSGEPCPLEDPSLSITIFLIFFPPKSVSSLTQFPASCHKILFKSCLNTWWNLKKSYPLSIMELEYKFQINMQTDKIHML